MRRRTLAGWGAAAFGAAVGAACGGDRTATPAGPAPAAVLPTPPVALRTVAGGGAADSALAPLADPLVVELRDARGELLKGVVVRFEAGPSVDTTARAAPALYPCRADAARCGPDGAASGAATGAATGAAPGGGPTFAVDTSDAAGRARVRLRLGAVAGRVVARVSVPEYGLSDTVGFSVRPGAPARVRLAYADTALAVGARATLRGTAYDRWGNARPEAPTLSAAENGAVTFDPATGYATARDFGTAYLRVTDGTAADSAAVRVLPAGRLVGYDAVRSAIRMIDLDGGNARTVLPDVRLNVGFGAGLRFDRSRGGVTFLAVAGAAGRGVAAAGVDTTGANRRAYGPATDSTQVVAAQRLPDGTARLVVRRVDPSAGNTRGASVWTVDAGGALREERPLPDFGIHSIYADVSPDGSRVAYVATLPSEATELRVLDVATGAVTLLEASGASPRWSPSGAQVAFLATRAPGSLGVAGDGPLAVVNADGTGRRLLSSDVFGAGLAWSPDGSYLVGPTSQLPNSPELRVMRVRDGAHVVLTLRDRVGTTSPAPGGPLSLVGLDWR